MSKFWKAYASISDDLRHNLIERPWYGREVTGNIDEHDMPALAKEEQPSGIQAPEIGPGKQEPALSPTYGIEAPEIGPGPAPEHGGPEIGM